jgi:hypothetical protein
MHTAVLAQYSRPVVVAHAALASTVWVLIIHVACSVFLRLSLGRALVVGSLPARLISPPLRISAVHRLLYVR